MTFSIRALLAVLGLSLLMVSPVAAQRGRGRGHGRRARVEVHVRTPRVVVRRPRAPRVVVHAPSPVVVISPR